MSDYQEIGSKWLASKRHALLADDMGLGKSKQAVEGADRIGAVNILVICPAVARVNWRREFEKWSIYWNDFTVCFGKDDYPTFRCVVSYDYATEYVERLRKIKWDLVICDECHFVKEPEAKRTAAIYGAKGIIRDTKGFWALSGTPAPNHPGEIWPLLYTFGATKLAYENFVDKFCYATWTFYHGKQKLKVVGIRYDRLAELKKILSSVMLRRLKDEVMKELPPISYDDIVVEATFVAVDETYEKELSLIENVFERGGMDALTPMAESVSTLRKITGLQKVEACVELVLQELGTNAYEKIVIFAIHKEVIRLLAEGLKDFGAVVVSGAVSATKRQENIDAFQNDPNTRVFIGNITAAGTAITLTAASQVLMVEQSWTPGDNAQAVMRCHRRGQLNPVFVRFVGIADSIDQRVSSVLKRKTKDLTAIFDNPQMEMDL